MKAVEWAGKFEAAVTDEEKAVVLEEYGVETAELIKKRIGSSDQPPTVQRFPAMDGAVVEQRNKFRAINNKAQLVDLAAFEKLLETHAPAYAKLKALFEANKNKPAPAAGKNDNAGRKFSRGPRNG